MFRTIFEMEFCRKQVKLDCEELLSRFQQTQSVRFEVFSNIWREMKFAQIFWGFRNHKKREFSRLVLDMTYCYFLPPFSFQIRVGGLYLLYSLYHCQTASPSEQIRLALKDWEHVKKFEKDAVDAQHLDAVYILQQLMFCKAFHFTAMPTLLFYQKKRNQEKSVFSEDFMEQMSRPQEVISAELLEEMSNISDLYENMKTSVMAQRAAPADSSVHLIRTNLVSQLYSATMEFYNWQQGKETVDDHESGHEEESPQQESSRRAELLASIKSKAYGEATEVSKSRRHRPVEADSPAEEAVPFTKSGPSRSTKPSLRSRVNETVYVSGDVWKDTSATTLISRLSTLDSVPQKRTKNKNKFKL